MTFFFPVVGLEAKRELDMGQLRERRRLTVPLVASLGGMALPVLIWRSTPATTARAVGVPRCRRTPLSRSASWHWSRLEGLACAFGC
jgi:Na+/H+ antiporter NhaA